jgi:hypothetical protein
MNSRLIWIIEMTKNETIARLARRTEKQRKWLKYRRGVVTRVCLLLYGCGGPLNDNKLQFTKEQLLLFQQIADELEGLG